MEMPPLTLLLEAFGALLLLVILAKSFTIAKGDQIIVLERRWFGAQMPDGRTVALHNEVGVQARVLGPGFHLFIPFIYRVTKRPFCVIRQNMVGVVRAVAGVPIPSGQFMAKTVACDLFQDGEAFLKNGGEKGPQLAILPEGEYKINPHLFEVVEVPATMIEDGEVGYVESIDGQRVSREGGNFGSPVECDSFQDAHAFIQNGGQKGPQIQFLPPGYYRVNTIMFRVQKLPITKIPGGKIGLVEATDGARIPEGRLLAVRVQGHSNFFDGEAFIRNGGEKGRQLDVLMPGVYRLNPMLFKVIEIADWTHVEADQVGIVTINEGKPIIDASKIAAEELPLGVHDNFQDADAFLKAGGQKGLQIPVLLMIVGIIALAVIMKRTTYGMRVYAVGGNRNAAEIAGINAKNVLFSVYALSGLLAGISGVMLASRVISGPPNLGQGYELDAIAAVVIGGASLMGGRGSIWGTALGLFMIMTLNNGLDILVVPAYWQDVIKGVLIVAAVAVDVWSTRRRT